MHTIWFCFHGTTENMHITIADINRARMLWDELATRFNMISERP